MELLLWSTLKCDFVLQQDGKLSLTGKLHLRRNDSSWKEQFFMVKCGDLVVLTKEVKFDKFFI